MALVINTNVASLNAQRQLMQSGQALDQATERLSSGQRINSAKDDAAGLAIANRMTSQIRGLDQAVRNANDGISMIQTAEGALQESENILQRMRELAVQSANGIYSESDRQTLDAEVQQLTSELDRIAETTTFNGQKLLDGSLSSVDLQVGSQQTDKLEIGVQAMNAKTLGMGSVSVDMMGAETDLSVFGSADAIGENDIMINGQSIVKNDQSFDSDSDNMNDLLGYINDNVNGVTASTYAEYTGDGSGDGVLEEGTDTFDVTITNLDGTEDVISVTGTESMQEIADKLNEQGGGKISASVNDAGELTVSGNNVESLEFADTSSATGGFDSSTGSAQLILTSENNDPITIARGANGTVEDLEGLGFRESNEAGVVEGIGIASGDADADWQSGDLTINGTQIRSDDTDSLLKKVAAINEVKEETGVTATAFASATLDFSAGGVTADTDISINGTTITLTADSTVSDISAALNAESDETGIEASVLGSRVVLEGSVSAIQFGNVGTGTGVDDLGTAGVELKASNGTAAALADGDSIDGGIQLSSQNGSPISVELADGAADRTGLVEANATADGSFGSAISSISIDTAANASKAMGVIDNALETVAQTRADLGAVNNRLDFTVSNLANVSEKTSAARSRIMDADFAAETANLSKSQVLQQASQAMLAQANARPQQVLSLLQ